MSTSAIASGGRLGATIAQRRSELTSDDPSRRYPRTSSIVAVHLYLCMCSQQRSNEVSESVEQIAAALAEHPRTVRRALEFLAAADLWRVHRRGNQHVGPTVRVPTFVEAEDRQGYGAPSPAEDRQRSGAHTDESGAEDRQGSDAQAGAEDRQRSGAPDVQGTAQHEQRTASGPPPEVLPEEKRGESGTREALAARLVDRRADEIPGVLAGLDELHGAERVTAALQAIADGPAKFPWPSKLRDAITLRIHAMPSPPTHLSGSQNSRQRRPSTGEVVEGEVGRRYIEAAKAEAAKGAARRRQVIAAP